MSVYRYVILDPTGNLTGLVLDPVARGEEPEVTRRLMAECEQTAYLTEAGDPGIRARLRLMGGEFCGNASMAAAAWLAAGDGLRPGEETEIRLEVSGAEGPVPCRIRAEEGSFLGTVGMPGILDIFPADREALLPGLSGGTLTAVRMEGILHLVLENVRNLPDTEAEAALRRAAEVFPEEEALGLLQWNGDAAEDRGRLRPLVWVRGSGTLVWETSCGSGSAAVGGLRAARDGARVTRAEQPGGTIEVRAEAADGRVTAVSITGRVRLGPVRELRLP